MAILGAHEFGHKLAAWRHGVAASPPYFLPAPPPFIGTFGAFIKIKSPIPTKEALVEMGASGPILGFLVALPITIVGLASPNSTMELPQIPVPAIFGLLGYLIQGPMGESIRFHPLAFAGLIGMFVTWLNLIPAGQLDGGHVARGLFESGQHHRLSRILGLGLMMFGLLFHPLFLLWGLFILILSKGYHTGALDDVSELSENQKILAITTLMIFLICAPIPPL